MKTEILRKDFFTVLTAGKIVISFKDEQILTFNILVPSADPKFQVRKNIKRSHEIIRDLMSGESVYIVAQNRVNELNAKPYFAGDYVLNNLPHQNFIK